MSFQFSIQFRYHICTDETHTFYFGLKHFKIIHCNENTHMAIKVLFAPSMVVNQANGFQIQTRSENIISFAIFKV